MARDTEGGKGTRDGRNPSCGESGGWQLLFDMCRETGAAGTRLERAEEAERAQWQEKDRKEVRQMASENFLKHFLLPRGVGFCCERCHRAQSMSATAHESQGTPDAAGSPRECESEGVCVRNTPYGGVHLQVIITTARITRVIKRTSTPALGRDLNVTSVFPTEFWMLFSPNFSLTVQFYFF